MPSQPSATQIRLKSLTECLDSTAKMLEIVATSFQAPLLLALSNTTQSLLKVIETVKQNKTDCAELMEQTYQVLNAIMMVHVKSDTGGELPPGILHHIGKFTETVHKIHTFFEMGQSGSKLFTKFFRQGEMIELLKGCRAGLKEGLDFFQVVTGNIMTDITKMRQDAEERHQEILAIIEAHSDTTSSDQSSMISRIYSRSHTSSKSFSMLPSEPKIFHGRESEVSYILELFSQGTPRIAILGTGGMGKTSLATAVVHHIEISARYTHHRFFVTCDTATTKVELAGLIGAHLGLKPGDDLTQPAIQYLSDAPPSLLILDNLETLWEPTESRGDIEDFLSRLADVDHLALVITMRGAERPAKVQWTRPFLPPLRPLERESAHKMFLDLADDIYDPADVDKVLLLTDNMPLAISLLAHLVDAEGCSEVLSRWDRERTSLISEGYDHRSNMDLSILISLSSPRIRSVPQAQDLLSLLAMLPEGLSNVELTQSMLPIDNVLACKTALLRTALAYKDDQNRLKSLVPIREYMKIHQPPAEQLVQPLFKHFQQLLAFYAGYSGSQSSSGIVTRIASNLVNIQHILRGRLKAGHPDLENAIYCTCHLNQFSRTSGRGFVPVFGQIRNILPQPRDHQLETFVLIEMLASRYYLSITNADLLISEALEHLEEFDDSDMKCKFYSNVAYYYRETKRDFPSAIKFIQTAISLAIATGNTKRHSDALYTLAWANWRLGDYSAAKRYASEAQQLARVAGNLHQEAQALRVEGNCSAQLGNYEHAVFVFNKARDLLVLCGMSGGEADHSVMASQAEVHKLKSEYGKAYNIQRQIIEEAPVEQDTYTHAYALLNLSEIAISIGAPKDDVERNVDTARKMFQATKLAIEVSICDMHLADLYLREGEFHKAKGLFEKAIESSLHHLQIKYYCFERLGDASRWGGLDWTTMSGWATVFLVLSLKLKERLGIHRALLSLGDIFLAQNDEATAVILFTVALDGFTKMDVHRNRAECMIRLADISKGHGDVLRAVELLSTARPLFERSSQAKLVERIDEKLACIGEVGLKKYRKGLASLAEMTTPIGFVEEANGESSGIKDKTDPSDPLMAVGVQNFQLIL